MSNTRPVTVSAVQQPSLSTNIEQLSEFEPTSCSLLQQTLFLQEQTALQSQLCSMHLEAAATLQVAWPPAASSTADWSQIAAAGELYVALAGRTT